MNKKKDRYVTANAIMSALQEKNREEKAVTEDPKEECSEENIES